MSASSQVSSPLQAAYSCADRNSSCFLLWRFVNLAIIHEFASSLFGQQFGDRGRKSRLSVVDMLEQPLAVPLPIQDRDTYTDCTDTTSVNQQKLGGRYGLLT